MILLRYSNDPYSLMGYYFSHLLTGRSDRWGQLFVTVSQADQQLNNCKQVILFLCLIQRESDNKVKKNAYSNLLGAISSDFKVLCAGPNYTDQIISVI